MTTCTFDEVSSLGPGSYGALPITVTRRNSQAASASTVSQDVEGELWYERLVNRISGLLQRQWVTDIKAVIRLLTWLNSLPADMPTPFIAVGDEGGIACEWDVDDYHLHVTFYPEDAEVYFQGPQDEWETFLSHGSGKVTAAVRTIAQVAHH